MSKEERNREFVRLWKRLGLGNEELAQKFDLSIGGVKSLKARLRKKNPGLYARTNVRPSREAGKSNLEDGKRKISFYLPPKIVIKLKVVAAERQVSASELAEAVFRRWLIDEGLLS
ncbi:MAG: hypothetical protein ACE5K3_01015 [bacterium]